METYNDQLFPPAFLVNYTKEPAGRQRVLTLKKQLTVHWHII